MSSSLFSSHVGYKAMQERMLARGTRQSHLQSVKNAAGEAAQTQQQQQQQLQLSSAPQPISETGLGINPVNSVPPATTPSTLIGTVVSQPPEVAPSSSSSSLPPLPPPPPPPPPPQDLSSSTPPPSLQPTQQETNSNKPIETGLNISSQEASPPAINDAHPPLSGSSTAAAPQQSGAKVSHAYNIPTQASTDVGSLGRTTLGKEGSAEAGGDASASLPNSGKWILQQHLKHRAGYPSRSGIQVSDSVEDHIDPFRSSVGVSSSAAPLKLTAGPTTEPQPSTSSTSLLLSHTRATTSRAAGLKKASENGTVASAPAGMPRSLAAEAGFIQAKSELIDARALVDELEREVTVHTSNAKTTWLRLSLAEREARLLRAEKAELLKDLEQLRKQGGGTVEPTSAIATAATPPKSPLGTMTEGNAQGLPPAASGITLPEPGVPPPLPLPPISCVVDTTVSQPAFTPQDPTPIPTFQIPAPIPTCTPSDIPGVPSLQPVLDSTGLSAPAPAPPLPEIPIPTLQQTEPPTSSIPPIGSDNAPPTIATDLVVSSLPPLPPLQLTDQSSSPPIPLPIPNESGAAQTPEPDAAKPAAAVSAPRADATSCERVSPRLTPRVPDDCVAAPTSAQPSHFATPVPAVHATGAAEDRSSFLVMALAYRRLEDELHAMQSEAARHEAERNTILRSAEEEKNRLEEELVAIRKSVHKLKKKNHTMSSNGRATDVVPSGAPSMQERVEAPASFPPSVQSAPSTANAATHGIPRGQNPYFDAIIAARSLAGGVTEGQLGHNTVGTQPPASLPTPTSPPQVPLTGRPPTTLSFPSPVLQTPPAQTCSSSSTAYAPIPIPTAAASSIYSPQGTFFSTTVYPSSPPAASTQPYAHPPVLSALPTSILESHSVPSSSSSIAPLGGISSTGVAGGIGGYFSSLNRTSQPPTGGGSSHLSADMHVVVPPGLCAPENNRSYESIAQPSPAPITRAQSHSPVSQASTLAPSPVLQPSSSPSPNVSRVGAQLDCNAAQDERSERLMLLKAQLEDESRRFQEDSQAWQTRVNEALGRVPVGLSKRRSPSTTKKKKPLASSSLSGFRP